MQVSVGVPRVAPRICSPVRVYVYRTGERWRTQAQTVADALALPPVAYHRREFSENKDRIFMTHVVTESCIRCRYTDCVDVCPVDCFREGPNFLSIDPDECIDCAVCVAECPVNAIYAEEDVPTDQQDFIKLNVELSRKWPSITKTKAALADADAWKDVPQKLQFLVR